MLTAGYRVICYRVGMYDYHFMRMDDSYWSHKPGNTQPLRYKYSPLERTWNNENYDGEKFNPPSYYYSSEVRFIQFSIPEMQYINNNRHREICPGCDAILGIEECLVKYEYIGNQDIGDYHRLFCVDCGHFVDTDSCRFQWVYYGSYNGVTSHVKRCIDCKRQNGTPQPCVHSTPGMCDYCG